MTNESVLDQVNEKKKLLNTILESKKQWLGHILRGQSLVKEVIEGGMEGKLRIMTISNVSISKPMSHLKRSSVEPRIENVGETRSLEPAFNQNNNDISMKGVAQNIVVRILMGN